MDNLQLVEIINRCKHLKHRFRGVFSADLPCSSVLKNDNTFMIMNASPSDQPGTHWLLFAQAGGQIFFADPLGKRLCDYPLVYKNMRRRTIHEGNQLLLKNQYNQLIQCYADFIVFMLLMLKLQTNFR